MTKAQNLLIPAERIERSILLLRGQKVMLDSDLAELYGVETGQLVRAVKRNRDRFPDDFAFLLTSTVIVRASTGPASVEQRLAATAQGRILWLPTDPASVEAVTAC